MKIKHLSFSFFISILSLSAFAADNLLVKRGAEQVAGAKLELGSVLKDLSTGYNSTTPGAVELTRKLTQIQRRLVAAERSLIESFNGGGGEYPTDPIMPDHPGYGRRAELSAKCEIDDDVDFTPGQMSGGVVKGSSVQELVSECNAIAQAAGSSQYSSGISDIKILYKPTSYVQATCEIDDDIDFTAGQFLVGELIGRNFLEISSGCRAIAKSTYGDKGSAGIKNPKIDASMFKVVADCHLDDDPDFTENQVVFGKIGGRSVAEVVAQCTAIAKDTYGDKGSSGLRNVIQR